MEYFFKIEFHGIQHYAPVKWFGDQSAFLEQCHRDAEKVLLAKEKNISSVVFDRNGYIYHGRIKAVADGARESGLEF